MKKKLLILLGIGIVLLVGVGLTCKEVKPTFSKVEYKPIHAHLATPENIRKAMKLSK